MANTKFYSIQEFHTMVREMVKEAIREEMVQELDRLKLKELGAQPPPVPAAALKAGPSGTKSGTSPTGANAPAKVGDNVKVPGSNLNLNQFLAAASKEQNFEKQKKMIAQAYDILTTLNTLEEKRSAAHLKDHQFKKKDAKAEKGDAEEAKKEMEDGQRRSK